MRWRDEVVPLGSKYLQWEQRGSVACVTLDRPERRNAMTVNMYLGIRRAVRLLESSEDLAALIITGSGDSFCTGGEMSGRHDDGGDDALETLGHDITPFEAIRNCHKPVVTMVNGAAQGGGCLLALVADVAVVSEDVQFRIPEVLRGVADSWYASYLPAHIGLARARDLVLTGRRFDALEAAAMGLVARVVPSDELEAVTWEVVGDLVRAAPQARWQAKRMLNARYGNVDVMTFQATALGPEGKEGFAAFAEKRSPSWVPEEFRIGRL
jgi:enoyl-CoA hydratase/carnithine racemase